MPAGRLAEYRLTPQAEADLVSIWRYTARTWSVDQAEAYVASFESSFHLLLGAPEIARERTEITPPVRLYRYRSHWVIYRIEAGHLLIVRVVHVRRNWQALIAG